MNSAIVAEPIVIDVALRSRLDAFGAATLARRGFVQATRMLTPADFERLVGRA